MGLFRRSKRSESLSTVGSVEWVDDAWDVVFPDGERIIGIASLVDACALASDGQIATTAAPKYDPPAQGTRSSEIPDGATTDYQMDNGRWLRVGTEFSVRGEPGRFIARWIKNGEVTAFGGREGHGAWRTFRLEDVRRVHSKPKLRSNQAVRHEAHQSADPTTITHCPFCGSGDVVGRSDDSVECVFCTRFFTVREQPQYPAMPGAPGTPGIANPAGAEAATPEPGALDDTPTFIPPGDPSRAPAFTPPADASPVVASLLRPKVAQRTLRTVQGHLLDEDAYIAHLALRHGNRAAVLRNLRGN